MAKREKASCGVTQAHIGKLIQTLREEKGITQEQFGHQISTTQSAIARIEKGEQNLTTEMISKISRALNRNILTLSSQTLNIQIGGGKKLSGEIITKTSKNGAMGLLCASLLNKNTTILKQVPKIEEVHRMVEVLESIGVNIKWHGNDLEIKPPKELSLNTIDTVAAEKTRSIIMLIGPLIHDHKRFKLPQPGGCKLGSRTVRPHFFALEKLGVGIETNETHYNVRTTKLEPNEIVLYESGDTVTENTIMAAARIPGTTTIKFASANYMGQELCFFLEKLGVHVEGIGTTTIIVHGKKDIDVPVTYNLSEDPIESMFFLAVCLLYTSPSPRD